jgi:hypothetical protein
MADNTNAFATPAFIEQSPADHTYVICSNKAFGCFGASSGGRKLNDTGGYNELSKVDILNHNTPINLFIPGFKKVNIPLPTGDAGIIYGINGVCHMAANRLMVQSEKCVHDARFSSVSFALFGVYGTQVPVEVVATVVALITSVATGPFWLVKPALLALQAMSATAVKALLEYYAREAWQDKLASAGVVLAAPAAGAQPLTLHAKLATGLEAAIRQNSPDDWADYHRFEMETVFKHFLGEDYDPARIDRLMGVHREWSERTVPLMIGAAADEPLSEGINRAGQAFAAGCCDVIGTEDYARLFGATPDIPVRIAVPEYENIFYNNMIV